MNPVPRCNQPKSLNGFLRFASARRCPSQTKTSPRWGSPNQRGEPGSDSFHLKENSTLRCIIYVSNGKFVISDSEAHDRGS